MNMTTNASQFESQGFPWPLPDAKREMREAPATREGFAEHRAGPIVPPTAPHVHGDPQNVLDARADVNAAIARYEAEKRERAELRAEARAMFDLPAQAPRQPVKRGKYAHPKLGHGLGHARNFKDDPNPPLSSAPREPGLAPDSTAARLARLHAQRHALDRQIAQLEAKL